jgi:methylthioribulose-1-phosphate dehydratase
MRVLHSLIQTGQFFHQKGWVPATGGNFSAKLADNRLLITASGWHKGELDETAFLECDFHGHVLTQGKPSYETGLHTALYRWQPALGAVLHTHSVANTVLSRRLEAIVLKGYELLKILPHIRTHDVEVVIPIFENDQDIARLAATVDAYLRQHDNPAYVIRGHGLYAWGDSVAQCRHRVEALEFLFECHLHEVAA